MSKHQGLFQPGYDWPESRSGNLPEILASDERKKGCVLPPIERNPKCQQRKEPTQPIVESTDNATIKRSGSVTFSHNDHCDNLNGYKSHRFLNNRTNATVFDGKVPNRREAMVEGLVRRDAASVAEQHPRASLDTKKSRNEKVCSTSENMIIEEIYLLSLNKRAIPMEQKSRRQGICGHSSLRETRSDEPNGGRGVSRYGKLLSRRVYYDGSSTDLSFPEGLATEMSLARKPRRQSGISGHRSLRKTRSDESKGSSENRPCGTIGSHPLATALYASWHRKEAIDKVVNMTGEAKAESEEEKGERVSRERASKGHNEAAGAAESEEEEQEQRWQLQVASEAKEEAKGGEEEMLACAATAESVERQKQQRRRRSVSKTNTETRDMKEESAESVEKGEQRRRRDGVCETVDKTAARRRRVKVLKKKLFGDDLPIDYDLMTEQETAIGRVLNKRL